MKRRTLLAILSTTATQWFGPARAQSAEIAFGILATESSANLRVVWQPLLEDLQAATGIRVSAFYSPDYAGTIEAMKFNKVQIAWMGNKAAMEAVDRSGAEVFAKATQADGAPGYWSVMIVHRDSPLKSLDDVLRQRSTLTLGFGDPNSTSGTLVPGYYAFAANKVDPTRDFRRTMRANHESNILAVANRQVDLATVASDGLERMKIKMPERHAELREIWRSPLISSDPLVWRRDLDPAIKSRLRDFFLAYGRDPREKEVLRKLTFGGFVVSSNQQLLPIRQLELVRDRMKLQADGDIGTEERARRLQAIEARLADLDRQQASLR